MRTIDLSGRIALITGASRGIGLASARALLTAGAGLVVAARRIPDDVLAELEALGPGRVSFVEGAIEVPSVAKGLIKEVFARHKRLDILVNNAGRMKPAPIGMISDADIDEMLGVNLIGTLHLIQAAARLMARQGGSIVNLTSIVGRSGSAGQLAYSAAKAGVIGATFSAAKELAPKGIRVNAVAPGFIETDLTAALGEDVRAATVASIGMGHAGTPEEVADVILFLASDLSRYVTGQVIGVDGGMVL